MSSGIKVNDDCKTAFLELKNGHKYRTVFYEINSTQTEIIVKETIVSQTFEELKQLLITTYALEPLYIVHDFHHQTDEKRQKEDVIFISWCPENSSIKKKMIHTSSKDALKKVCGGIKLEVQANEEDDLDVTSIIPKLK